MGIPIAQAAQPISQQQPSQGKGSASHPLHGTAYEQIDPQLQQTGYSTLGPNGILGQANNQQPMAQTQVLPGADSTTGGVPNQAGSRQTFHDAMGKGNQQPRFQQSTGKSGGQPNEFTMSNTTNTATSGQPMMGRRNPYSNTIQPWDNSNNQTQVQSGKGKGH